MDSIPEPPVDLRQIPKDIPCLNAAGYELQSRRSVVESVCALKEGSS